MAVYPTVTAEVELSAGTWTAITNDLRRQMIVSRGIPGNTVNVRIAKEGTCKFHLANSASNSAGLEGYYSLSHANKLSGWGRGVKMRVKMSHASYAAGADQTVFVGWITKVSPVPGKTGERLVYVEAVDFVSELNDYDQIPQTAIMEDVNSDQAYQKIIDDMSVRPEGTNFISEYVLYDGVETYARSTDAAFDNLTTADFTIEGWFRMDSRGESNVGHFFAKGNVASGGWRFWTSAETAISVQTAFSVTDINHGFGILDDYVDGTFKHFAFQWDATAKQWELWINGEYIGTDTLGGASGTPVDDSSFDFYIGASASGGALSIDGAVGWCRLSTVKRYTTSVDFDAKTKEDIPSLDDDTLALWRFNDGDGSTIADATSNGYDLTLVSGEWTGARNELDLLRFVFHRSGERSGTAYEEMSKIAVSVFDFLYVRADGYLVLQTRADRINEVTVQQTFNADLVGVSHDDDRERVIDRIISTTYPVGVASGQTDTVYSLESPIKLIPGESKTITARYTDENTKQTVGLTNPVTPVADTHYKFSSQPNSTVGDYNDNLTISVTWASASATVTLTNDGNGVGWVNVLDLVGDKITFYDSTETTKVVTAGKHKTVRVDMPYQESADFASASQNMIGDVYGSSQRIDGVSYWPSANTTTMAAFFNIDVGKRIAVTETITGLNATEGFVQRVDWTLHPGNVLDCSYLLSPTQDTSDRAIVGTSTVGSGVIYFSGG